MLTVMNIPHFMQKTWDDGGSVSYTEVSPNLDSAFGRTPPKAAPKATPAPKPKGTQSGHAVTSGKNTTKPVK